jgi:ABC-type polysaccharide/polyol phosphate export permease
MGQAFYTDAHQRQISRIVPELFRARELLLDLVWKDVRVRYRYAMMGFLWAVLEPLALMTVLVFVFSVVFRDRVPVSDTYTEFRFASVLLCGLVPWQFFANAITSGTRSLVDNSNLVTKVHFPREVIPLAAVGTAFVNFFIGFIVLIAVLLLLEGRVGLVGLFWCGPLIMIQTMLTMGLTLLLSAIHVRFRDVGYIVGVAVVFGFYATPVFYTLDLVQQRLVNGQTWVYRLYMLNPMAGLVESYRHALLLNRFPAWEYLLWPLVASILCIGLGMLLFRRLSPTISDHL